MSKRKKNHDATPMDPATKAYLIQYRKEKKERQHAERVAAMQDVTQCAWRRNRLSQYVARVLALSGNGAARLKFFDDHPLSNLFD